MAINKIIDPGLAAQAYQNNTAIGNSRVSGDDGVSFSEFLEAKARQSINTMEKGEEMSAKAVTGEADLTAVVQAVTDAELTLQTVVAVRDRMMSAYQEIMRMAV